MLAAAPARPPVLALTLRVVLGAAVLALSFMVSVGSVRAATFTVNSTTDDAPASADGDCETVYTLGGPSLCTLREAIQEANSTAGPDVINVPAGTYQLTNARNELFIFASMTIVGAGAATTTIVGSGSDGVIRLSDIGPDFTADISGITISGGNAVEGGGILVQDGATLNLVDSVVTGSTFKSLSAGAGIYVSDGGTANLTRTAVTNNVADVGGGGILVEPLGTLVMSGSSVSGNTGDRGGGILNFDGDVTIANSTITGNAISGGPTALGGGIYSSGSLAMSGSTVGSNSSTGTGGGIYLAAASTADIVGSTLSANTASTGAGIGNFGTLTITNSTLSGNSTLANGSGVGGGLRNVGTATVTSSTIASNSAGAGGGVWNDVTLSFMGTIVGDNAGGDCGFDPTPVSLGNNLDTDGTCPFTGPGDRSDANAGLGALADNGGGTMTRALLPGSAAIDGGQAAGCPATDQRGVARPQDGDANGAAACDIGAFELLLPAASISDVSITEGNSGTVAAVFTVTLSGASGSPVSFTYATASGSATAPADYASTSGAVSFAPGDVSETITVQVSGDTIDEPNETFTVTLSSPTGATLADAAGTGTILDDDGAPSPTQPPAAQLPDTATAAP
jgi:CSLREA domain-containing protein